MVPVMRVKRLNGMVKLSSFVPMYGRTDGSTAKSLSVALNEFFDVHNAFLNYAITEWILDDLFLV